MAARQEAATVSPATINSIRQAMLGTGVETRSAKKKRRISKVRSEAAKTGHAISINMGSEAERWRVVREQSLFKTDEAFAKELLDR
jgi:hypothetical protein